MTKQQEIESLMLHNKTVYDVWHMGRSRGINWTATLEYMVVGLATENKELQSRLLDYARRYGGLETPELLEAK